MAYTSTDTPSPRAPTDKQKAVLEFLWSFQESMGRTPTGPEIARHFGFSDASSSYEHLRLLDRKGYIKITRSGRRTPLAVRLTGLARNLLETTYPLFGSVPAGPLEDVITQVDRGLHSIEDLVPSLKPGDYFLTVEGDSMIDAGLEPGTLVVIRPKVTPNEGDICAVWIEGLGNTLKRIAHEGDQIVLYPANKRYEPRSYAADSVRVQGVLIASLSVKYHHR